MFENIDIKKEIASLKPEQTTARGFLTLLDDCSKAVLQDAAIMISNGRKHSIFELPVFKTDMFQKYLVDMKTHIQTVVDHSDLNIERCLPTVLHRFNVVETKENKILQNQEEIKVETQKIKENMITKSNASGFFQHIANYNFDTEILPEVIEQNDN